MIVDTSTRIRQHLISTFLFDEPEQMIPDDASLLEAGVVDSTGVLDLICFIEEEFGVTVADEDIVPANFDSVERLRTYVEAKQGRGLSSKYWIPSSSSVSRIR